MALQKMHMGIVLSVAVAATVSTLVFALLSTSQTVSNNGNIKAIGVKVYKDSGCTQVLLSIDWQTLAAGSAKNYTAYVLNEGTVALTLSKATTNWSPSTASKYITLNWNRDGYALAAGTSVQAIFNLSVASNITGVPSFTFDIVITGTER